MAYKSTIAKFAANLIAPGVYKQQQNAVAIQQRVLQFLLTTAANTDFGKAHKFGQIKTYEDYKAAVKIYDYEDLKTYIELITQGKKDVLWPGLPLYFCKSSGTTSGAKYIPVTRLQINEMIKAARTSLMLYVAETGNSSFFDHKMIFLQGSPELQMHGKIPCGRLSGIVYNHVPFYVNQNRMPSYEANCINDWEEKVDAIAKETLKENMSLISGIPPWVVMYFERLKALSGKEFIKDIFPDFKLFSYGGVNYEPYRQQMEELIGFKIDSVEAYPASEGYIAYQDSQKEPGLLLNINGGIFYEFIKADEVFSENPKRISLADVELDVNYALVLNTTAGLFGYSIGDTVKFVSLNPYRILVTGRLKHFTSAFGEHVIGEEVEAALRSAMRQTQSGVTEFTVAPQVTPTEGLPYHEWFVEFSRPPQSLLEFAETADIVLQEKNVYYKDLRRGNILQRLVVRPLKPNAFVDYMKSKGKLGGQNKVPRLTNDRHIADDLREFKQQP
ncbi:MAG: GH3 auxin-responsive promoter family protein [Chitinophagales bacterium]|nr:GH3 auxin-responsive promoter family protein [Chitinophagales bacterium]